jgi:hypothetical protein
MLLPITQKVVTSIELFQKEKGVFQSIVLNFIDGGRLVVESNEKQGADLSMSSGIRVYGTGEKDLDRVDEHYFI